MTNPIQAWLNGCAGDGTSVPDAEDFVAYIILLQATIASQRTELYRTAQIAEQQSGINERAVRVAEQLREENTRLRAALDAALRA